MSDLKCSRCVPSAPTLSPDAVRAHLETLHPDWRAEGTALVRRFDFRNFAHAMQHANLAGWLGERAGHHPDIAFGWGWCEVRLTSHEAGGLTESDISLAQALDRIVA